MKYIPTSIIIASLLSASTMKDLNLVYERSEVAKNYPSGSTISRINDSFYIMGDDAAEILVLNQNLEEIDRIEIFSKGEGMRLPKTLKADVESSVVLVHHNKPSVLFLGSGSLSPHRDSTFLFDPELKQVTRIDTKGFFDKLRQEVDDLNVEAAAMMGAELLLGLRGNTTYPDNYIAVADVNELSILFKRKILIQVPLKNVGISGMDYHEEEDILFLTFSSEDTSNAYEDGQIGESYLAVLPNAREALKKNQFDLSDLTKLSDLSPEFKEQKIESVALMNEHRKLMLVADDDKGNSKIFTVRY